MSVKLESDVRAIRIALERIADHLDPAGKKEKAEKSEEPEVPPKQRGAFVI